MKKLNFNEMENVIAGGCGRIKRAARTAFKLGLTGAGLDLAQAWRDCKAQ